MTWGFDLRGGAGFVRYGFAERWTRRLQAELGSSYYVIEDGLNGRTTVFDDPVIGGMSGLAQLPTALKTHMPLDLAVILLGSNDAKTRFGVNGDEIARCLGRLLDVVMKSNCGRGGSAPKTLVLVPPIIPRWLTWLNAIFFLEQVIETITVFGQAGFIAPGGTMNVYVGGAIVFLWVGGAVHWALQRFD